MPAGRAINPYSKLPSAKSFAIFCIAITGVVVVANWLLNAQVEERKNSALTSSGTAVGATGGTAQLVAGLFSVLLHGLASLGVLRANWMVPPQQDIVKPVAISISEQAAFQKELADRVSVSDTLRKQYAADEAGLAHIVERANDLFLHMVSVAPDRYLFCELQSVLRDNFKIELCADDEVPRASISIYAYFHRMTNKIVVPLSKLTEDVGGMLRDVFRHEVHHAKVNSDNRGLGYRFFDPQGKADPNSTPCPPKSMSQLPTLLDCTDINNIQSNGLDHIGKIPGLYQKDSLKNSDMKKYIEIMRQLPYKSNLVHTPVSESNIKELISKKIIAENLEVLNKKQYIGISDQEVDFLRYGQAFYRKGDQFFSITRSHKMKDALIAPLLDLEYMLKSYKKIPVADKIKEYDAVIMQVFGPYPELMQLFFPDYHSYHEQRSEEAYQQCVAGPNP